MGPGRSLMSRRAGPARSLAELSSAAQRGAQTALGRPAVEAYVQGAGQRAVASQASREPGGVEAVPPGDEDAEFVAAHRVGPGDVVNAGAVARSRLQEGGGQVGDVHRAADVVGEQGAVAGAGGEFMYEALMD